MKACAVVKNVATNFSTDGINDNIVATQFDWDNPDLSLIDGPDIPAPPFPINVLGSGWEEWCHKVAKGANAPLDYVAGGLLSVAASFIGNARMVAASESWSQPCILWLTIVGGPSAGKSPALGPLNNLIAKIESDLAIDFDQTDLQFQSALQIAKAHHDNWTACLKEIAKNGGTPPDMPENCIMPNAPVRPRVALSDTTMEAAAEIASGNPKGLLMYREELAGWWRSFNRYGGDGERKFWIEAYDARPYTIDRKKNGRPIVIPRLAMCVLGGVQPDALSDMLLGEQDGFAARFIFAFPEPVMGFELKAETPNFSVAERALRRLRGLELINDGNSTPSPYTCRLCDEAALYFECWWRNRRNEAMTTQGLWGQWLGKQGGQALRLALVLEHLWWSYSADSANSADSFPEQISSAALKAATELIDQWSAPMARRVFGSAAASAVERDAAALANWLRRENLSKFNAREAERNGKGCPISNNAAMKAACDELVQAGIIRQIGERAGGTPGRKRRDFEVNALLFTA
jgi:hypothetical protein